MISMTATPGATYRGATGLTYKADANGLVRFVRTSDVDVLRDAGAMPTIVDAVKHLKVVAFQMLHFAGKAHQADANGLLMDVPHDQAVILIKNGVAKEATQADLEDAAADHAEAIQAAQLFTAIGEGLLQAYGAADIVDTGETAGPQDDTIFSLTTADGTELARGTISELQAKAPAPKPVTAPAAPVTAPTAEDDEAE